MIVIKRDNPQVFGGKAFLMTKQESFAVNTVSEALVNRGPLTRLLQQYNFNVAPTASNEEVLEVIKQAYKDKAFSEAFTKAFAPKSNFSNTDGESSSDIANSINAGFGAGSGDNANGGNESDRNSTLGTGQNIPYISAAITGIGTILGLFSKPNNTGAQLNYNQQILALAQEKEKARKRNNTIAIISVLVVIIGATSFLLWYAKKNKAI